MPRRKRSAAPTLVVDETALEWRLSVLSRSLFPFSDDDPRRQLFEALARYRTSLERRALPLSEQVGLVEAWLEERGRLDSALRLVDELERARERW